MRAPRTRALLAVTVVLVAAIAVAVLAFLLTRSHPPSKVALPLRKVGQITLPGDNSRFDYASLDPGSGLLFIAHLGASEVVELNIHTGRVVRTIAGLPDVHGVLVVPKLRRVYATATGSNTMATIDEDNGQILTRTPTGDYPDGLTYDPTRRAVWVTNENGGSETVVDAATGGVRGTVRLGGEAGNVAYDPVADQILVDVQTRNTLAVIDPATLAVTRRVALVGCDHDHGLTVDHTNRLAFIACDGNATLLTLNLRTWHIAGTSTVGQDPDVLAYDPGIHRLYVAAESGWLTTLDTHDKTVSVTGRAHLAVDAHVVAVDPTTHRTYYPVPDGTTGHPILAIYEPVQ